EVTGLVDRVVDTDEEALDQIRRFLSYMPSHNQESPPAAADPAGSGEAAGRLATIVPDNRRRVYDVRKVIDAIVDKASFFELKPKFGATAVIGLARLNGASVGIVANNPMGKAGAMDVAACEKITRFL